MLPRASKTGAIIADAIPIAPALQSRYAAPIMTTRVRFAPSPTGFLHIGGARTALYNWLYARQTGGTFILRIEDTDTERSTKEYVDAILDGMRWLGLDWDEGPYYQMDNADKYAGYIQQLLDEDKAYRCYCSTERLDEIRQTAMKEGRKPTYDRHCRDNPDAGDPSQPHVIRFKAPLDGTTLVKDLVRGEIAFDNKELDDLVIQRTNGTPTYNFVVVIDDVLMKISHVIRGDDHLNNTPRQMLIYEALGFPVPTFAHLPMILGSDKKRLSKRHGATAVGMYRDDGYLPEGLLNYLARLGWSHGDQEVFTLKEMVDAFSFSTVGKAGAIFNPEKLDWVNAEHFKKLSNEELTKLVEPFLAALGCAVDDLAYASRAVASERERGKTLKALAEMTQYFFQDSIAEYDDKASKKWLTDTGWMLLHEAKQQLESLEDWSQESLSTIVSGLQKQHAVKFPQVAQPLRIACTGSTFSPSIDEVLAILGKERSLARIEALLGTKKEA